MIRVGFRQLGWAGGRNYLWNLFHALGRLPAPRVRPVVVAEPGTAADLLALPGVERVTLDGPLGRPTALLAGRVTQRLLRRDLVLEGWFRRGRVDVASHVPILGRRSPIPTLFWIPDLQHLRLPQFFDERERRSRDRGFQDGFRDAAGVILSSEDARRDIGHYFGASAAERCHVLRFVSQPRLAAGAIPSLAALVAEHGVPARRFFHLPNQFWAHKNHRLVVEALALARAWAPELLVVATGAREDYRNPTYYDTLMAEVAARGVADNFVHLGNVSFPVLTALMQHAIAVVNPSLFEGWSTTVEEAKSLGKTVLLSDLPVHREQAPPRGRYFGTRDASALADLLVETAGAFDPAVERVEAERAAAALPERMREFALTYERIVDGVHGK
jgi:Glycosyl transferases group 1